MECVAFYSVSAQTQIGKAWRTSLPPRGWNSYDSYSWIISEEEFLQSAQILSEKLKPVGYEVLAALFYYL